MSYKQVGKKDVPLTENFAKQFAALPCHAGDRERETPIGRTRIAWLRNHLENGTFHDPSWATCMCREDGVTYRVNGGHSSLMLAECNGSFPKGLKATVLEFVCDSKNDLADLFDIFDPKRSSRSTKDRINAHAACEGALTTASPTAINKSLGGIAFYYRAIHGAKGMSDEDVKVRLIHEHPQFIAWATQFVTLRRMARTGVIAAMFASWSKDEAAATTFWLEVRDESNPNNRAPSRLLATFLRENAQQQPTNRTTGWDVRAYYAKSIHAWNSYRAGTKTDLKYYAQGDLPKAK